MNEPKEYRVIWELPRINKVHDEHMDIDGIHEIFAYNYWQPVPDQLREQLWSMKQGQSVSHRFPALGDKLTIIALVDIQPPPF